MLQNIDVGTVATGKLALSNDEGHKLHEIICRYFDRNTTVNLSFHNVDRTTTAFLNVAIGQLYGNYDEAFIREHLKVTNAADPVLRQIKRVVEGAKLYFADKEAYQKVQETVFDD